MTEDKKHPKSKPREDDSFGFDEDDHFDDEHLFEDSEFEVEGWSIPHDPESVTRLLRSLEGLVPGILRRVGVDTQSSETPGGGRASGARGADASGDDTQDSARGSEGFRARLGGVKLPREVINFILQQVDTTKREFLRIASNEVRLFLESADLGGELAKILTTLSFEVRMEVRFIPNDQALKPAARGRMRVKRNRAAGEKAGDDSREDLEEDAADVGAPPTGEGEEMPGLSDVFNRRRWSLRRRLRAEDESQDLDADSQAEEDPDA